LLYWKMPSGTLAGRARDIADVEWVMHVQSQSLCLRRVTHVPGIVHCYAGLGRSGANGLGGICLAVILHVCRAFGLQAAMARILTVTTALSY
jgi:hypothetical protein